ncbi:Os09g0332600 [Oryza sativa Japonica Group]|uniref:Os09g0332600 protein n=2 Tax=Oryza sativa subsp. japonica TaxID=39947 RepID=Q0J2J5_ORYSJ|nr:hypothetical protein EE612_047050 [Oryza sativa]BAF24820.1 Os09g0332600 [Oryza sativa Japonica Group]BAT07534.1 Os09g0332600 [Oryza sativa Japonica Group]|eukprot:NP_001062906.1 Os09g0332600 [Oryza sativa Japonica Group]
MVMLPSMYPLVFLPANTSINVVFPAPLTPIRAVSTPGLNEPLMPFNSSNRLSVTPCALITYKFHWILKPVRVALKYYRYRRIFILSMHISDIFIFQ